jgi:hypothetical protein
MLIKERVTQGLPKSYSKAYFDLIDVSMHNKPCFNPSHSRDFMNLNFDYL